MTGLLEIEKWKDSTWTLGNDGAKRDGAMATEAVGCRCNEAGEILFEVADDVH